MSTKSTALILMILGNLIVFSAFLAYASNAVDKTQFLIIGNMGMMTVLSSMIINNSGTDK